jgi:hypothetical protein
MEKIYGKWDYFTSFINDGISGGTKIPLKIDTI